MAVMNLQALHDCRVSILTGMRTTIWFKQMPFSHLNHPDSAVSTVGTASRGHHPADIMAHQAASRTTITTLPTDVLSCIVHHIQENALQRDQRLDNVAALRTTCRSMHNAVDATVTHATIHPNVDVAELRSIVHRCDGE